MAQTAELIGILRWERAPLAGVFRRGFLEEESLYRKGKLFHKHRPGGGNKQWGLAGRSG